MSFSVVRDGEAMARALSEFLALEAQGWKAARGTAMAQHAGDAAFIAAAAERMAPRGAFEIASLRCGEHAVASAIVLRQGRFASWFKLGIDPAAAKFSPGMQLALELTRHYCDDPGIDAVDCNSDAETSMADHAWRGRMQLADLVAPVRAADPLLPMLRHVMTIRRMARDQARVIVRRLRRQS